MFEEMSLGFAETVEKIKADRMKTASDHTNDLIKHNESKIEMAELFNRMRMMTDRISQTTLLSDQAGLWEPIESGELRKPTGCPQRIWDRASESTKAVLIEAARSK